jgi:hypothetical protein
LAQLNKEKRMADKEKFKETIFLSAKIEALNQGV